MDDRAFFNPIAFADLPKDWQVRTIDSLCLRVTSGGTPLRSNLEFYDGGTIRWIKTKELKDWYIDDTEEKITSEAVENSSAKIFPPNTVLMAMYGDGKTITSLGILRKESATNQACCAMMVDPKACHPLYLFYSLKYHRSDFIHLAIGGAQRNLSGTIIRNFAIRVPPLPEQRDIAHILGTLDDKIELNRRMNETLEAMARAIFKSWFVDFDPVRAKAERRQPAGMDAKTASLFPDSFEDSALGEIPKGWEIKPLDEIASYLNGLALQKFPPEDDNYLPVIKIAQLRKNSAEGADKASTLIDSAYIVDDGDILFSWSGSLEVVIWCGGKGALNQHLFKVTSVQYPHWFYYYWTKYHLPDFQQIAAGKATTMGHIQRHHLSAAFTVVPLPETLEAIDKIMAPLLQRIINNNIESRTLAALRDALLPKLMSGEVRVISK